MTRRHVRGHAEFGERQKGAASVAPAVETREGEGEFVGRAQPGDDGAEDAVGEDLPCPLFVFRITRTVDAFLRHLINMQPVPGTVSISSNYFVEHDPPQSPHSRKRLSRANLVRRRVGVSVQSSSLTIAKSKLAGIIWLFALLLVYRPRLPTQISLEPRQENHDQ